MHGAVRVQVRLAFGASAFPADVKIGDGREPADGHSIISEVRSHT